MGLNVGFIVFGLAVGVVCVSGDCGVPPSIPNASHDWPGSTPIPEGTTVTYQCSTVYKPKLGADDATYVCSAAAWTDGNFECKQITCGHIEPPTNGRVVNEVTYVAGSNMKFACNEGYTLSGTSNLICRTDGSWMPNYAPSCNLVSCPELPDIAHATTQLTYSINGVRTEYASVIKVMCTDGYIAEGSPNVECQANGQWTQLPTCSQITCSAYPGLNSSCINQIAWEEELLLLYLVCNTDHTSAAGPINDGVSCTEGGWSDESMACYCDCHVAADLSVVQLNNVDASGYIKHGHTLLWSCKNGGSKIITVGSELCNDGSITVPECQPAPSVITTQEPTQTPTTTAPFNDGSTTVHEHPSVITTQEPTQAPTTTTYTKELQEEPFNVFIVVIIIAVVVLGAIVVAVILTGKAVLQFLRKTFNSNENSGADVEFKSGKDAGNGAEVAVSTHGKKIAAEGERAHIMST